MTEPAELSRPVQPWFRQLLETIPKAQELYMIVDAAHDERIFTALSHSQNLHCCLFNEEHIAPELEAVAPHLIKIRHLDDFTNLCLQEGIRHNWLILFSSSAEHIMQLRLHFKHYSLVTNESGREFLFRYYDPRVLPSFISASTSAERGKLFQPLHDFYIPTLQANNNLVLMRFGRQGEPTPIAPITQTQQQLPGSWAAGHTCLPTAKAAL